MPAALEAARVSLAWLPVIDPTFHALANHIRGQLFSRAVA
jgi:hypothetical protein